MSTNVQFKELEKKYKKIIPFLHIESKFFKAGAFLEAFHSESSKSALKIANKKLGKFIQANSNIQRKMIYFNSAELLEVSLISSL